MKRTKQIVAEYYEFLAMSIPGSVCRTQVAGVGLNAPLLVSLEVRDFLLLVFCVDLHYL